VIVDAGTQLDFLDLDDLLTLARLRRLLLLEEAVFPEIEDLADGRRRIRDDLDEIEAGFLRLALGVREIDDAVILALGVDELNLHSAYVAIDARASFLRRRSCLHGTTNGHSPVFADPRPYGRTSKIRSEPKPCGHLDMGQNARLVNRRAPS
jgi:hypothetical protein